VAKSGLKELNLAVWNNEDVTTVSGYSITDLKQCLHELTQFISSNLSPNRLAAFDMSGILSAEAFNDIPNKLDLDLKNL